MCREHLPSRTPEYEDWQESEDDRLALKRKLRLQIAKERSSLSREELDFLGFYGITALDLPSNADEQVTLSHLICNAVKILRGESATGEDVLVENYATSDHVYVRVSVAAGSLELREWREPYRAAIKITISSFALEQESQPAKGFFGPPLAGQPIRYTVKEGDTLWDLAREFSTTVAVLTDANPRTKIIPLYPGNVLTIPAVEREATAEDHADTISLSDGGDAAAERVSFEVPVVRDNYTEDELLVYALTVMLGVSDARAEQLAESGLFHLRNFTGITIKHLTQGYIRIRVKKSALAKLYGGIAHIQKEAGLETALQEAMSKLEGLLPVYLLNQKDKELSHATLAAGGLKEYGAPGYGHDAEQKRLLAEYVSVRTELAAALNTAGLTQVEYDQRIEQFEIAFRNYAVDIAFQMLDNSHVELATEEKNLTKSSVVAGLFTALQPLEPYYVAANQERVQQIAAVLGWNKESPGNAERMERLTAIIEQYAASPEDAIGAIWRLREPTGHVRPMSSVYEDPVGDQQRKDVKKALSDETPAEITARNLAVVAYGKQFPVLTDPATPLRSMVIKNAITDFQQKMAERIGTKRQNVAATRARIAQDPNTVWELLPVIAVAKLQLRIANDSLFDHLIKDKIEAVEDWNFYRNIGLAALAIGLGIASIFTGGATAAIALGVASAMVSGLDAYITMEHYLLHAAARDTDFDPLESLSQEDPALIWVVLSIIAIGVDVAVVAKLIMKLRPALIALRETGEIAKFDEVAEAIGKQQGLSASEQKILAEAKANRGKGLAALDEIDEVALRVHLPEGSVWHTVLDQLEEWIAKLLKQLEKAGAKIDNAHQQAYDALLRAIATYWPSTQNLKAAEDFLNALINNASDFNLGLRKPALAVADNTDEAIRATSASDEAADFARHSDQMSGTGSTAGRAAQFKDYENLLTKLGKLDEIARQKFLRDFANASEETLKAFELRPALVDAWKVLDDAGSNLKTTIADLVKVADGIDEVKDLGYTLWKQINEIELSDAFTHLRTRKSAPRKKGIVGCHDETVFFDQGVIRSVDASGGSSYAPEIGRSAEQVEEIVITSTRPHSSVPAVQVVEYKVPALSNSNPALTTGQLAVPTNGGVKTLYDPTVWTDPKLEKALIEALQDSAKKTKGITDGKFNGVSKDGFQIEGYLESGKVTTFYFL